VSGFPPQRFPFSSFLFTPRLFFSFAGTSLCHLPLLWDAFTEASPLAFFWGLRTACRSLERYPSVSFTPFLSPSISFLPASEPFSFVRVRPLLRRPRLDNVRSPVPSPFRPVFYGALISFRRARRESFRCFRFFPRSVFPFWRRDPASHRRPNALCPSSGGHSILIHLVALCTVPPGIITLRHTLRACGSCFRRCADPHSFRPTCGASLSFFSEILLPHKRFVFLACSFNNPGFVFVLLISARRICRPHDFFF